MSFYDDASLVFLPSGEAGKDGKAYSMKPTNGDGDFTFSRGSNLTATRVDSNGLIEKGRENLLLQSNQFDTTWTTSNTSVTSGQSGYDGSSDAWELEVTANGTNNRIIQSFSQTGIVTFSVYAKASSTNFIYFYHNGTGARVHFDLQNGTFGNAFLNIDSKIEAVSGASGWYRCSMTINATSSSQIWIIPNNALGNASTDLGNSIFIQDAQAEIGLVATEPIESGATTGKAGILEDSPRFDYSGGASCPSLLLEPSRTNLVKYSEYFEDSSWGLVDTQSPTANDTTAPDGQETAYKIVPNTNNAIHYIFNTTISLNGQNTISVFAKYNGYNIGIRPQGIGSGQAFANFDLQNGTILGSGGTSYDDSSITSFGDGWYRISMTMDNASTYGINFYAVNGTTATELPSFTADGTSGIYLFGAQVEQGSYPTSYIPNHSGGSVTRNAETNTTANISSVIGQQEGTFFLDFEYLNGQAGENENWIALESENGQERVMIYKSAANNYFRAFLTANNSLVFNNPFSSIVITPNTRYKIAFRYSSRDIAIAINGNIEFTDSSTYTRGSNLSRLLFNETNVQPSCRVHQSIVFDSGLTNSELENLTS